MLLPVLQLKLKRGTHPQRHSAVKHRDRAQDRPHSSKVTSAAASLQVSAGSAVLHSASAHLVLPPEFTASSLAAPQLPWFSKRQQQSWEITRCYKPRSEAQHSTQGSGKGGGGGKVQCCDGKASQHRDLTPVVALPC